MNLIKNLIMFTNIFIVWGMDSQPPNNIRYDTTDVDSDCIGDLYCYDSVYYDSLLYCDESLNIEYKQCQLNENQVELKNINPNIHINTKNELFKFLYTK